MWSVGSATSPITSCGAFLSALQLVEDDNDDDGVSRGNGDSETQAPTINTGSIFRSVSRGSPISNQRNASSAHVVNRYIQSSITHHHAQDVQRQSDSMIRKSVTMPDPIISVGSSIHESFCNEDQDLQTQYTGNDDSCYSSSYQQQDQKKPQQQQEHNDEDEPDHEEDADPRHHLNQNSIYRSHPPSYHVGGEPSADMDIQRSSSFGFFSGFHSKKAKQRQEQQAILARQRALDLYARYETSDKKETSLAKRMSPLFFRKNQERTNTGNTSFQSTATATPSPAIASENKWSIRFMPFMTPRQAQKLYQARQPRLHQKKMAAIRQDPLLSDQERKEQEKKEQRSSPSKTIMTVDTMPETPPRTATDAASVDADLWATPSPPALSHAVPLDQVVQQQQQQQQPEQTPPVVHIIHHHYHHYHRRQAGLDEPSVEVVHVQTKPIQAEPPVCLQQERPPENTEIC